MPTTELTTPSGTTDTTFPRGGAVSSGAGKNINPVANGTVEPQEFSGAACVTTTLSALSTLSSVCVADAGRSPSAPSVLRDLAAALSRVRDTAAAKLCQVAGALAATESAGSPATEVRNATRMSQREANRMTRLAEQLEKMPNVADSFASGEIGLDQAAALGQAGERCGPGVVDGDASLLDQARRSPADLFRRKANAFAGEHSPDRGEPLLRHQRKNRSASIFPASDGSGTEILHAVYDPVMAALIRQSMDKHSEALWRADGGRDNPKAARSRSRRQRYADALFERVTGLDAISHQPLSLDRGVSAAPTQLIVTAELGLLDGTKPYGRCEILDVGPVPPTVLEGLSRNTQLTGIIFGGDGQPLWLGRKRRLASIAQRLAVAVRDGGCVECGEPVHNCEIHHILEWSDGGLTDVDNLQALCGQHHRHHHHATANAGGTRPGRATPARSSARRSARRSSYKTGRVSARLTARRSSQPPWLLLGDMNADVDARLTARRSGQPPSRRSGRHAARQPTQPSSQGSSEGSNQVSGRGSGRKAARQPTQPSSQGSRRGCGRGSGRKAVRRRKPDQSTRESARPPPSATSASAAFKPSEQRQARKRLLLSRRVGVMAGWGAVSEQRPARRPPPPPPSLIRDAGDCHGPVRHKGQPGDRPPGRRPPPGRTPPQAGAPHTHHHPARNYGQPGDRSS